MKPPRSFGSDRKQASRRGARRKGQSFVGPAGDAADHDLYRPAETGELQRRLVRAVAMRAGAVDDEQRFFGPFGHAFRADLAMRQVQRARHVLPGIGLRRTDDMQQNEIRIARPERGGDIRAVGLDGKAPEEMFGGDGGGCGGVVGDEAHGSLSCCDEGDVAAPRAGLQMA